MLCQRLLDDVRQELNDPREVRWSNIVLLAALNDALLALAGVRPDAVAITDALQLVQGTKQSLPAGGLRLIKITRNLGADGETPGRPIYLGDMAAIDALMPTWHSEVGTGAVFEYFYDPLLPKEFYVYPGVPVSPDVHVQASYAVTPDAITEPDTEDLPVDDTYAPALREWMLYRAWGGDDESSPNYSQARDRRNTFFALLGVKAPADVSTSAKPARAAK